MHASFFKEIGGLLAGSSRSKQLKLLYRYNYESQDKYRRRIVLSFWKLYFHFVYFKVYGTIREAIQSLSNDNAYANCWKSLLLCIQKLLATLILLYTAFDQCNQAEYTKYIIDAIKYIIPWCMHAGTLLNFDENSYIIMTSLENVIAGLIKTLPKSLFPSNFDQVLTLLYFCMRSTINHGNASTVANIVINKNTFAVSLISSKPIITSTYKTARNISTCRVFCACSIQWALIFIYMEMVTRRLVFLFHAQKSFNKPFEHLLYKTYRLHFSVHVYCNRSNAENVTSQKRVKNNSHATRLRPVSYFFCSLHAVTSSMIHYITHAVREI